MTYPDGSYTKYCILDGRVIGEIVYKSTSSGVQWSHGVRYIYGDDGSVVGFGIWDADTTDEWERYYFVKNLQGDVLKVYRDADNALVASYEYDPFGNILSAAGEMADENPFRYRGYHYDTNTGFYYLQSRYYDLLTCQFIIADEPVPAGQGAGAKRQLRNAPPFFSGRNHGFCGFSRYFYHTKMAIAANPPFTTDRRPRRARQIPPRFPGHGAPAEDRTAR